jgi:hypothetical protein
LTKLHLEIEKADLKAYVPKGIKKPSSPEIKKFLKLAKGCPKTLCK